MAHAQLLKGLSEVKAVKVLLGRTLPRLQTPTTVFSTLGTASMMVKAVRERLHKPPGTTTAIKASTRRCRRSRGSSRRPTTSQPHCSRRCRACKPLRTHPRQPTAGLSRAGTSARSA